MHRFFKLWLPLTLGLMLFCGSCAACDDVQPYGTTWPMAILMTLGFCITLFTLTANEKFKDFIGWVDQ